MNRLRCRFSVYSHVVNSLSSPWKMSSRTYWYRRGYIPPDLEPGTYPFPKRQVPEIGQLSYADRIAELTVSSDDQPDICSVDIGLPYKPPAEVPSNARIKNLSLETAARKRSLRLPVQSLHDSDSREDTHAPLRRLSLGQHYGVFDDIFGSPHFFVPSVDFNVFYTRTQTNQTDNSEEVYVQPVYMGNLLTPSSASLPPTIDLSCVPSDHLWTLVMTCPDEPMGAEDGGAPAQEYIHWMLTNLPGGCSVRDCDSGNEMIPYLPPLPYVGTGLHRFVFILYRQDNGSIDLSDMARRKATGDLRKQRAFSTTDFYRRLQDDLTPAGLVFFQSPWDESVRNYYRNVLDHPEPIFELVWPEPKMPPQERHPVANSWCRPRRHPHGLPLIRERFGVHNDVSFDVYLDRYRDRKELNEEIVRERLEAEGNPLDSNEPRREKVEFPAALPMPEDRPTWWVNQEKQRRLRRGRWKHLDGND